MLPLGLQDFETLRTRGYIYVDKTEYIHRLIRGAKYQFLSRPRRFGKSLLISTLKALFEGKKELFSGLWIEQHDFVPRPVIHLDFNRIEHREADLADSVVQYLGTIAEGHGVTLNATNPRNALDELITKLAVTERVVILVDEYDKPITDVLGCVQNLGEGQKTNIVEVKNGFSRGKLRAEVSHTIDARMGPAHTTTAHSGSDHGVSGPLNDP